MKPHRTAGYQSAGGILRRNIEPNVIAGATSATLPHFVRKDSILRLLPSWEADMKMNVRVMLVTGFIAVLAIPVVALAADRFKDVPTTNIFHDDIAWLAENGITFGCNPPDNDEFCPKDDVTREQMAAFMRRLANRMTPKVAEATGTQAIKSNLFFDGFQVASLWDMEIPFNGGALHVTGQAEVTTDPGSTLATGFVWAELARPEDGQGPCSPFLGPVLDYGSRPVGPQIEFLLDADAPVNATVVGAIDVDAGPQSIHLCVRLEGEDVDLEEASAEAVGNLVVTWIPTIDPLGIE